MIQWEYNGLILSSYAGDNIDTLNDMAGDGWELVTVDSGIAYMKRRSEGGTEIEPARMLVHHVSERLGEMCDGIVEDMVDDIGSTKWSTETEHFIATVEFKRK